MTSSEKRESETRRWLGLAVVLVLLGTVAGIGLISSGVFDPQPHGELASEVALEVQSVEANSQLLTWLDQPLPAGNPFSVRLSSAHDNGETNIGYGLVIGDADGYLVTAVSPLGYVSAWSGSEATRLPEDGESQSSQASSTVGQVILPWQTWPHVKTGSGPNEIWVDVENGNLTTIRINRELLWQGNLPLEGQLAGLWLESFGGAAEVEFQELQMFAIEQ